MSSTFDAMLTFAGCCRIRCSATNVVGSSWIARRSAIRLGRPFARKLTAWSTVAQPLRSHLLYRLGFVCKEDKDGYLVGPLNRDVASAEDVHHMNRYMARAWVEVSIGIQHYRMQAGERNRIRQS